MMTRRRRRRFAAFGVASVLSLGGVGAAAADPLPPWSGKRGGFAWEAKRLSCGVVGETPSRLRAHTRWTTSLANGYVRLTFTRQVQDADTGAWATVQRQRRSTRNTRLEGTRAVLHWSQWFFPFEDEGGSLSRHTVVFEWLRDRRSPRADRLVLRRTRSFGPCLVAP
jgi:hypothetical protein